MCKASWCFRGIKFHFISQFPALSSPPSPRVCSGHLWSLSQSAARVTPALLGLMMSLCHGTSLSLSRYKLCFSPGNGSLTNKATMMRPGARDPWLVNIEHADTARHELANFRIIFLNEIKRFKRSGTFFCRAGSTFLSWGSVITLVTICLRIHCNPVLWYLGCTPSASLSEM